MRYFDGTLGYLMYFGVLWGYFLGNFGVLGQAVVLDLVYFGVLWDSLGYFGGTLGELRCTWCTWCTLGYFGFGIVWDTTLVVLWGNFGVLWSTLEYFGGFWGDLRNFR